MSKEQEVTISTLLKWGLGFLLIAIGVKNAEIELFFRIAFVIAGTCLLPLAELINNKILKKEIIKVLDKHIPALLERFSSIKPVKFISLVSVIPLILYFSFNSQEKEQRSPSQLENISYQTDNRQLNEAKDEAEQNNNAKSSVKKRSSVSQSKALNISVELRENTTLDRRAEVWVKKMGSWFLNDINNPTHQINKFGLAGTTTPKELQPNKEYKLFFYPNGRGGKEYSVRFKLGSNFCTQGCPRDVLSISVFRDRINFFGTPIKEIHGEIEVNKRL